MTATPITNVSTAADVLFVAFELGDKDWKRAFTVGMGQKPRLRSMRARNLPLLHLEIAKAKKRFALPAEAPTKSCYEAGRDGSTLPKEMHRRLVREHQRRQVLQEQIRALESERRQRIREDETPHVDKVRDLLSLWGVGLNGAWLLVYEMFVWRQFDNRKQVGGSVGLTPTPYQSGDSRREQGISRAGLRFTRRRKYRLW